MELISKIIYQARIKGLEIEQGDEVLLRNPITKKYLKILPNGKILSDDILGHDSALKELVPSSLVLNDPFSGSFICVPCEVTLRIGRETSDNEIFFAEGCLTQSFANIKNLTVVEDPNLLQHECRVDHKHDLSFKERQVLIKACLEYLK